MMHESPEEQASLENAQNQDDLGHLAALRDADDEPECPAASNQGADDTDDASGDADGRVDGHHGDNEPAESAPATLKRKRRAHLKSHGACAECHRLKQKCNEAKPSCSFCARKNRPCDYTPRPRKPIEPKPRKWEEPKPLLRAKATYPKKRKQDVVLWLIHHRVEDVPKYVWNEPLEMFLLQPDHRARDGSSGTVEKEPRIMPDGSKKWFRTPTYDEAVAFWKIPQSTITDWWRNRVKILDGDVPEPEIPLVSANVRKRPPPSPPPPPPCRSPPPPAAPDPAHNNNNNNAPTAQQPSPPAGDTTMHYHHHGGQFRPGSVAVPALAPGQFPLPGPGPAGPALAPGQVVYSPRVVGHDPAPTYGNAFARPEAGPLPHPGQRPLPAPSPNAPSSARSTHPHSQPAPPGPPVPSPSHSRANEQYHPSQTPPGQTAPEQSRPPPPPQHQPAPQHYHHPPQRLPAPPQQHHHNHPQHPGPPPQRWELHPLLRAEAAAQIVAQDVHHMAHASLGVDMAALDRSLSRVHELAAHLAAARNVILNPQLYPQFHPPPPPPPAQIHDPRAYHPQPQGPPNPHVPTAAPPMSDEPRQRQRRGPGVPRAAFRIVEDPSRARRERREQESRHGRVREYAADLVGAIAAVQSRHVSQQQEEAVAAVKREDDDERMSDARGELDPRSENEVDAGGCAQTDGEQLGDQSTRSGNEVDSEGDAAMAQGDGGQDDEARGGPRENDGGADRNGDGDVVMGQDGEEPPREGAVAMSAPLETSAVVLSDGDAETGDTETGDAEAARVKEAC